MKNFEEIHRKSHEYIYDNTEFVALTNWYVDEVRSSNIKKADCIYRVLQRMLHKHVKYVFLKNASLYERIVIKLFNVCGC